MNAETRGNFTLYFTICITNCKLFVLQIVNITKNEHEVLLEEYVPHVVTDLPARQFFV